jgi:hypothetical protein
MQLQGAVCNFDEKISMWQSLVAVGCGEPSEWENYTFFTKAYHQKAQKTAASPLFRLTFL